MTRPRHRSTSVWDEVLPRVGRLLPPYLAGRRWFGGKGRRMTRAEVVDTASLRGAADALLAVIDVSYADRGRERYLLPLTTSDDRPLGASPPIVRFGALTVRDAFANERFCRTLLAAFAREAEVTTGRGGSFRCTRGPAFDRDVASDESLPVRVIGAEQSNTSVVYGDALILKGFRRLQPGINPDIEILRFLSEQTDFKNAPGLGGWAEYRAPDGMTSAIAILQTFVPNQGDGWSYALRELAAPVGQWKPRAKQGAAGAVNEPSPDEASSGGAGSSSTEGIPPTPGTFLANMAELGRITARLHLALASSPTDPDFAPRPIATADVEAWRSSIVARLDAALGDLRGRLEALPAADRGLADQVLAAEPRLRETVGGLAGLAGGGVVKTRLHGDYHLGQVLKTAASFVILDFEGEPLRPLAERRARHTPLKDVAGMLRSFTYARHAAARGARGEGRGASENDSPLDTWEAEARRAFLDAYLATARSAGAPFLPQSDAALRQAVAALEHEKALYELQYELGNRPDWVAIPLTSLAGR